MKGIATLLIDHADGPIMWAWMASLLGFVLAARADMPIADWLLPIAVIPLFVVAILFSAALIRALLGR